jgi:hypothetical protein
MKNLLTSTFIENVLAGLVSYFNKNNNFLISLKITSKQNELGISSPFTLVNNINFAKFMDLMTYGLNELKNKNFKGFKHLYYVVYKIPRHVVLIDKPLDITCFLPNSMLQSEWDSFILDLDFLRIKYFQTTVSSGFVQNKIKLLDSRTNKVYIIYDVRELNDSNESFVRTTKSYLIQYINGDIVRAYQFLDNNNNTYLNPLKLYN